VSVVIRGAVRCVLCAVIARHVAAQGVEGARAGVIAARQSDSSNSKTVVAAVSATHRDSVFAWQIAPRVRGYAPLISAVVPGGGQLVLGEGRFLVYTVIEVIGWWNYQKNRNELSHETEVFKAIASGVARAPFTANPQDREWAYYEQMRDFLESGPYSTVENGPVTPPTDITTYNGYKWQLALQNNATRAAALADYDRVAAKPDFQWSWKNHRLERDIFIRTIALRNDAYQRGSNYLLAVGANHVLSMIDAFATIRLRVQPTANGGTSIGASLGW
jgi:hypothetical protein